MGKIATALILKLKHIFRIVWPSVLTSIVLILSMVLPRASISSKVSISKSTFLSIFNPAVGLALIIAGGAIFMSIDLIFYRRSRVSARRRYTMRSIFTEDDIYVLYQSPLSVKSIIFLSLLVNFIVSLLIFVPIGAVLALTFTQYYGTDAVLYLLYSILFISLAYVHGYSLYLMLVSPYGIENRRILRTVYYILLALTCAGPLIAYYIPNIYFISPSATYALAVLSLMSDHINAPVLISILYTVVPLIILNYMSCSDYNIKPFDVLYSTSTILEIAEVRVFNVDNLIDIIVKRSPLLYTAYGASIAVILPAILKLFNVSKMLVEATTYILYYFIFFAVGILPINLVYTVGTLLGVCGWMFMQLTKPFNKLLSSGIHRVLRYSLIPFFVSTLFIVLDMYVTHMYSSYVMMLIFLIASILLSLPLLRIFMRSSVLQGLKVYLKSGNIPVTIDLTTLSTLEEIRDRIIISIPFIMIVIGALIISYGITLMINNMFKNFIMSLVGISVTIVGFIAYIVTTLIVKFIVGKISKL